MCFYVTKAPDPRRSIVVPDSAVLHHEMLKAVESRKAKDVVMTGASMARRTDGRVFQDLIGFPSERYATSPAPVDAARTQQMAKRIAHCDRVEACCGHCLLVLVS